MSLNVSGRQSYAHSQGTPACDRCNTAKCFMARDVGALQRARAQVGGYPPRPSELEWTVKSPAVDALLAVLSSAPRRGEASVQEEFDRDTGDTSYSWNEAYNNRVEQALVDILKEQPDDVRSVHWNLVRWKVYDKYADCMSGMDHWVDGRDLV